MATESNESDQWHGIEHVTYEVWRSGPGSGPDVRIFSDRTTPEAAQDALDICLADKAEGYPDAPVEFYVVRVTRTREVVLPPADPENEYDGLDLRDVLCICAVLVAAGAEDDEWIKRVCSAHAHEVLGHPDLLVLAAKVADDPPLYDPECICGSWDDTHPGDCPAVRAIPPGLTREDGA